MEENTPKKEELTVIQYLSYLPQEIRQKAIYYAKQSENYEFNLKYPIDSLKKSLILSFDFMKTTDFKFWFTWLDKLDIPEERRKK